MNEDEQPIRDEPPSAGPGGPGTGGDKDVRGRGPAPGADGEWRADGHPRIRLTRSRRHKALGGVCGGLGRYFDLDPVIFRVSLVVLSVISGLGLVFYGFAWLLVPAEGARENELRRLMSGRVEGSSLSAVFIALVGCGLFLAQLDNSSTVFALLLAGVVTGAAHWSQNRRRSAAGAPVDPATAHAVAEAPPETQAPPVPSAPSWWRDPLTKTGAGEGDGAPTGAADSEDTTEYLWGPANSPGSEQGVGGRPGGGRGLRERRAERNRRHGRPIGCLVFLLAVVAAVIGTAGGWNTRPLGTSLVVGLSCALAVFGAGLAISAFFGRLGGGTVVAVVVTAVLLAGAAVVPKGIGTDWRNVTWTPASVSDTRDSYRLGAGRAELDLREVDLKKDQTVSTAVGVGAGQLKVVVPRNARVELDARAGAGDLQAPLRTDTDGLAVFTARSGIDKRLHGTLEPFGGAKAEGTLELKLHVDAGQAEIVRQMPSGERSDGVQGPGPGGAEEAQRNAEDGNGAAGTGADGGTGTNARSRVQEEVR